MTNCPKCSHRVESFAVDTNCSFRMCSNVACTWPFECADMGRYFDHDATVPSIRKRAKKRKAPKDESRKKVKKIKGGDHASTAATAQPTQPLPLTATAAAPIPDNVDQISSWLSDLCDSNIKGRSTCASSSQRLSVVEYPHSAGNYHINQGSDESGSKSPVSHTSPNIISSSNTVAPYDDATGAWIDSLLASSSSPSSLSQPISLNSNSAVPPLSNSAAVDSALFNDNVADIFAVLGHGPTPSVPSRGGSVSADAGVPRNSRMNSPATSNSESGAEEIDSGILSSDELAMIIGSGSNAMVKPQTAPHAATAALSSGLQHPSTITTTSLDTTGSLFDPISMLLSPPNSATTALPASQPTHGVTAATTSESLDLFSQYYWPTVPQQQQQSNSSSSSSEAVTFSDSAKTLAPADEPFDLNKYLDSVTAASGNAQSGTYIDAALGSGDIIDDIFGKSSL
ncbi:hypothetical protein GGI15_001447 [Coemansia interrupta]|uniref:Uncharacterized protein n=1 Tax=Coemansia interrupta TaxID=1126814 RepID=A0A9W8HR61_9FUNG|nr:hypothetical protein GGI15_001447 [Coemansia interrupta]